VAGALIVLTRAVHVDRDAAEILQTANVDGGLGRISTLLERYAGNVVENIGQPFRIDPVNILQRDNADRREHIDRRLLRLHIFKQDRILLLAGRCCGLC
jgi:hypothetical protein